MRFFDTTPVGKIVTRLTNDVEAINEVFSNILVKLFRNVVKMIGLAAIMISLNPRMALYSFILLPVIAALTLLFRMISRKTYRLVRTRLTALNTFLSEHLSGMKVIRIFGQEQKKFEEFEQKNSSLYNASFREMMVFAIFRPGIYLLSIAALMIIMLTGGREVLGGAITIGTLYIFLQYINSFFEPIQELAEQFTTLQSAISASEKIFTLLDTQPAIPEEKDPVVLPEIRGKITFDHVWFSYSGKEDDWVLKDVSFEIAPGQSVAFVGATGAGKSSILNLIGRYYDIQKGSIRIDDTDIRDMSREQIRRAVGQVQQDVFLFTGDIASNIRLRDESISDDAVREAAREVNAARFIDRLPDGYASRVTERGATFSAGERQLLSFARTLAYDPRILILDEATANIDTETEMWIQEAVTRLMRGRTSIMVAHRLSTIQHCDRIIVMHHGRIRETGTHQELLAMDGIYKKLYQLQLS
jgi:ATP-binding cassette subfamily B protein